MDRNEDAIKSSYQGLFITETVLGNPNGSFVNNEPRNIEGQVFTTDKCIKYNIRQYLHQNYEDLDSMENFIFFYPRKSENSEDHQAKYMTKTNIFKKYFNGDFDKLLKSCPDTRLFGGTFSFKGGDEKNIYGPVQISYGIDLIGADIINHRLGTPFASDEGKQKTTGEHRIVDHAVISYDVTVNPKNSEGLLKKKDLEMFKEGIIKGTNLRKTTSKTTDAKVLMMVKFKKGKSLNIGELKHLIKTKSKKITDPNEKPEKLVLDFYRIKEKLDGFKSKIEQIELYKDKSVEIENFYIEEGDIPLKVKGFHEL